MFTQINLPQGLVAIGVKIPVALVSELPELMQKREKLTFYELSTLIDVTVGDMFLKEVHSQLGLAHDERLIVRATPVREEEVLYVGYAFVLPHVEFHKLNVNKIEQAIQSTVEILGTEYLVA